LQIGNNQPYVPTSTSHQTPDTISITYGSGGMNGTEYVDQVSLGPDLTIPAQMIGVASQAVGFAPSIDGIIG
jgi:cathepsin E